MALFKNREMAGFPANYDKGQRFAESHVQMDLSFRITRADFNGARTNRGRQKQAPLVLPVEFLCRRVRARGMCLDQHFCRN